MRIIYRKCHNCHYDMPDLDVNYGGSLYCTQCGAKMNVNIVKPYKCDWCGSYHDPSDNYCSACGCPLKNLKMESFIKGKIAVQCKTKEDAIDFLKMCDDNGLTWAGGRKCIEYIEEDWYKIEKSNTTFACGEYINGQIEWDSKFYYENEDRIKYVYVWNKK